MRGRFLPILSIFLMLALAIGLTIEAPHVAAQGRSEYLSTLNNATYGGDIVVGNTHKPIPELVAPEAPAPADSAVEILAVAPLPDSSALTPRGYVRLHDKESGSEILCFRDSARNFRASIACTPTGRRWR